MMLRKPLMFVAVLGLMGFSAQAYAQYPDACGCSPVVASPAPVTAYTVPVQSQYTPVAQTYLGSAPQAVSGAACCPPTGTAVSAYRPLVPVARNAGCVEVGRGLLGQPKAYVPGQPVRNFFRYLAPF